MSFREESDDGRDIRKPFLHTGSWYRMGSRQSSMMGSSQVIRESSISVVACVLIVALGPIQFGFTVISPPKACFCLLSTKKDEILIDLVFFSFCCCVEGWLFFTNSIRNHRRS